MAVARMLKVTAICHQSVTEELVERLRKAGVLDVVENPHDIPSPSVESIEGRLLGLEERIAQAQFTADFLGRYHEVEAPFSSFISEKIHMEEDEFYALAFDAHALELYRECELIADRLATIERERERLRALIIELTPWRDLRLQIAQWKGTENVALFTGTVPAAEGEAIRQRLREVVSELTVEELGAVGSRSAWVVMAHKEHLEDVKATLNLTNFAEVSFPALSDYPAEEIDIAEDRLVKLTADEEHIRARAVELAEGEYAHARALAEALAAERDALLVHERFGTTERTVVVSGWVAEKRRETLDGALGPLCGSVDLTYEEPTAEDAPPVELDNPKWLRPFEVLTDLYGRPKYDEVDPTPLMAAFFWLFFGMALADVGYGIVLMVVAWLIKKRLDVAPGVKKFMDLLVYGGAASIIVGIVTGSYFAMDAEMVPDILLKLKLFDPLYDIMAFLVMCIALGVVHITVGIITRAISDIRAGDWRSAVASQFSTLLVLVAIAAGVLIKGATGTLLFVGFALAFVLKGRVFEAPGKVEAPAWDRTLGWVWIASLVAWFAAVALSGPPIVGQILLGLTVIGMATSKTVRKAFLSTLVGAYDTYGMSGLISDFLSYTRLAALGLAGFLVGNVANRLGGIIVQLVGPVAGIVFGAVVVLVLHAVNLVMNLLGAFVHPTRLQFVEFFKQFYEGGGRNYAPLGPKTKSLVLHPRTGAQEGGKKT